MSTKDAGDFSKYTTVASGYKITSTYWLDPSTELTKTLEELFEDRRRGSEVVILEKFTNFPRAL